jgi:hypothetical protein
MVSTRLRRPPHLKLGLYIKHRLRIPLSYVVESRSSSLSLIHRPHLSLSPRPFRICRKLNSTSVTPRRSNYSLAEALRSLSSKRHHLSICFASIRASGLPKLNICMAHVHPRAIMVRPQQSDLNSSVINIEKYFNLVITVKSLKNDRGERYIAHFEVSKEVLRAYSDYFAASLRFNPANNHSRIILEDDDINAFNIWLLCMHLREDRELFSHSVVREANITTIWHMIDLGDKYRFDGRIEKVRGFFETWWRLHVVMKQMKVDFARQLALPCFVFDHASAFAEITRCAFDLILSPSVLVILICAHCRAGVQLRWPCHRAEADQIHLYTPTSWPTGLRW